MCGVPVERADDYLQRLIGLGHRVAVCEQTEDPAEAKKRGAKSVVRRDVVRLVTPGTITEDTLLDPGRGQPARRGRAPARSRTRAGLYGLAAVDISTGPLRADRDRRRRPRRGDSPGSSRARSSCRTRSSTIPRLPPSGARPAPRVTPLAARRARSGLRRAAPEGFLRRRDARRFGTFARAEIAAAGGGARLRRETQLSSAAAGAASRRRARRRPASSRSTPRRAPISS